MGALLGNALTVALAAYLTWRLWSVSRTAALCVAPMVLSAMTGTLPLLLS